MYVERPPTLQEVISDDLNIEVWSAKMKTTLTEKGLWDVVANKSRRNHRRFCFQRGSLGYVKPST